jgi:hypothetical protein
VGKAESFEKTQDGSDGEDVVDVDVGDEAGEGKIVDSSDGGCSSGCTGYEVGNFEGRDVGEVGFDGTDEARFRRHLAATVLVDVLEGNDRAVFSDFDPRFQELCDGGEVVQVLLFSDANREIAESEDFDFVAVESRDRGCLLQDRRIDDVERVESFDENKVLELLWEVFLSIAAVELPGWSGKASKVTT